MQKISEYYIHSRCRPANIRYLSSKFLYQCSEIQFSSLLQLILELHYVCICTNIQEFMSMFDMALERVNPSVVSTRFANSVLCLITLDSHQVIRLILLLSLIKINILLQSSQYSQLYYSYSQQPDGLACNSCHIMHLRYIASCVHKIAKPWNKLVGDEQNIEHNSYRQLAVWKHLRKIDSRID